MKKKEENWSFAVIISGPSRTSDIEKQLVLGAHGPKKISAIIIKD
jgi:L-lactate dehydrogenase complex protein LldG